MNRALTRTIGLSLGVILFTGCSQGDSTPAEDAGIDIGIDADTATDTAVDVTEPDISEVGGTVCGDDRIDAPYEHCEPNISVSTDAGFAFGTATCTDTCRIDTSACAGSPICGDGTVDGDESCDDGNLVDDDGCSADCTEERCGDGITNGDETCDGDRTIVCSDGSLGVSSCSSDCGLETSSCLPTGTCGDGELNAGEACDDGNDVDGDGCESSCVPTACGNGVIDGPEHCDGNAFDGQTCASLGFTSGTLYCSNTCRFDTERCEIAVCGDGRTSTGEACDDGNRVSGDGCSRDCVVEYCGDGRLSAGEQCDGVNVRGLTCASFGYALAPLRCDADCNLDLSGCEQLPLCGDGMLDADLGEECDDGNAIDGDGCAAGCVAESCGDGVVQSSEVCEPGIAPSETCIDQGFVGGALHCDPTCQLDVSSCLDTTCGNGTLDDAEVCDGPLSRSACLDEGFDFGRLDCTDTCELSTERCHNIAMCGDGQRAGSEECDDGNFVDGDGCSLDCLREYCGDGIVQPALSEACDRTSPLVAYGCGDNGERVGTVSCAPGTCTHESLFCETAVCGNGIIEQGEACDDANSDIGDGCDATCRSETCGDEVIQDYEACDGGTDATCADIGILVGEVSCIDCAPNYSECGSGSVCGNGFRERDEECDDGNPIDADGCNTACEIVFCATDERVLDHLCVPCSDTEFNDPGDDPTLDDTFCEQDACSLAFGVRCDDFNEAYIKASNTEASDLFGRAVALSADGNTLAVGAFGEDSFATGVDGDQSNNLMGSSGAVYVFVRDDDSIWTQQAYIKASNTSATDRFGTSVSLSADGSTLAVGANGERSNATGVGGDQSDNSLFDAGAVYVFVRDSDNWTQQAYVKASNTGDSDRFGGAVALSADGSTLAVGAHLEDSAATGVDGDESSNGTGNSGAVYVFVRDADNWAQQAYIKASNTGGVDWFGSSVALSAGGNTLVVGAFGESSGVNGDQSDNSAGTSGAVYVFVRDSGSWTQQAYIKAPNIDAFDRFGTSVALSEDGNTLAVGAQRERSAAPGVDGDQSDDNAPSAGAVYVLGRNPDNSWTQQAYLKASNPDSFDYFGTSVALSADGNTLAVGAEQEASSALGVDGAQGDNSAENSGAVYVFTRAPDSTWTQQGYINASNTDAEDNCGTAVALSADGTTVAIGAGSEASAARGVDGAQSDNSADGAGAVYVRLISDGSP